MWTVLSLFQRSKWMFSQKNPSYINLKSILYEKHTNTERNHHKNLTLSWKSIDKTNCMFHQLCLLSLALDSYSQLSPGQPQGFLQFNMSKNGSIRSFKLLLRVKFFVVQLLSHVWLFATPWTIACQALLSMGFPKARILEWVAISFSRGSSWIRG